MFKFLQGQHPSLKINLLKPSDLPHLNSRLDPEKQNELNPNSINFTNEHLKIICWNIRGFARKLCDESLLNTLLNNSIIILLETMKGPNYDLDIKNYSYYNFAINNKHPNASRYSGEIGILVKNALTTLFK